MPIETVYGIMCLASNKKSIERINKMKLGKSEKNFNICPQTINDIKMY